MNTRAVMSEINEKLIQVDSTYLRIAKHFGLSYNALMMLYIIDETDEVTQKQVCDTLYLSKSSVHSMMRDLINHGYLVLEKGGNNKEKYMVFTDKGRKFMAQINHDTDQMEDAALQTLSEEEMARFLAYADRLAGKMKEETDKLYGKQ